MLRTIKNKLAGRKKTIDESLEFSSFRELLSACPKGFSFFYTNPECDIKNMYYSDREIILNLLDAEFKPQLTRGFGANHQVFTGKKDEKHYVDIRASVVNIDTASVKTVNANLEYTLKRYFISF